MVESRSSSSSEAPNPSSQEIVSKIQELQGRIDTVVSTSTEAVSKIRTDFKSLEDRLDDRNDQLVAVETRIDTVLRGNTELLSKEISSLDSRVTTEIQSIKSSLGDVSKTLASDLAKHQLDVDVAIKTTTNDVSRIRTEIIQSLENLETELRSDLGSKVSTKDLDTKVSELTEKLISVQERLDSKTPSSVDLSEVHGEIAAVKTILAKFQKQTSDTVSSAVKAHNTKQLEKIKTIEDGLASVTALTQILAARSSLDDDRISEVVTKAIEASESEPTDDRILEVVTKAIESAKVEWTADRVPELTEDRVAEMIKSQSLSRDEVSRLNEDRVAEMIKSQSLSRDEASRLNEDRVAEMIHSETLSRDAVAKLISDTCPSETIVSELIASSQNLFKDRLLNEFDTRVAARIPDVDLVVKLAEDRITASAEARVDRIEAALGLRTSEVEARCNKEILTIYDRVESKLADFVTTDTLQDVIKNLKLEVESRASPRDSGDHENLLKLLETVPSADRVASLETTVKTIETRLDRVASLESTVKTIETRVDAMFATIKTEAVNSIKSEIQELLTTSGGGMSDETIPSQIAEIQDRIDRRISVAAFEEFKADVLSKIQSQQILIDTLTTKLYEYETAAPKNAHSPRDTVIVPTTPARRTQPPSAPRANRPQ